MDNKKIHKENPTWFREGHIPWLKGTKGLVKATPGSIKKGERRGRKTEFKKGNIPTSKINPEILPRGENHLNWKGNSVGYGALHCWIYRNLGRPEKCEFCDEKDRKLTWANKSGEYKRDLDDWISLCYPCHKIYDKDKGSIKQNFDENRLRKVKCVAYL